MQSGVSTGTRWEESYEASRIERQYQATEPENRLVAAELEKRWNNALTHLTRCGRRFKGRSGSTTHSRTAPTTAGTG